MFCYIFNYLLTWILKLDKICLLTLQTDHKFCLDGLNLKYQTVSCHWNCAVIKWIGGWKIENPCFQFKRFDPHVFHQGAIAVYYVPTPVQHSQMRCEWGALGYLANSWRAAARQIAVMSRPSICETKIQRMKPDGGNKFLRPENLKVSGIANILVRWLSVEALRPVTRPNAQWHHLFRRPYLGKVEIRKCGTVGPHWNVQLDLMAVFPSSSFQKTNWFCDVLFLSTWTSMFNNLNNRHRRKSTNQTKKTNEPATKQANKQTMRWNSVNCKPKSKPKLVCNIVMTSPIQVANGVPHDFQGGRSFKSSTMS